MLLTIEVTLLVLAYVAGWLLTLFGLPGTWLMVVCAAAYAWLVNADGRLATGWTTVLALLVLALVGELFETFFGAAGARQAGASRRAMLLAVVGSIAGAIVGAGAGLPIPVVGSVVGAILGAALGAFLGALAGEVWKGRALEHGWRVGEAAFKGRLVGTLAKLAVATVMLAVGLAALGV